MTWCLTAPSHDLNQCWLITSKVHWHSYEGNFAKDTSTTNNKNQLEITFFKFLQNLSGANELRSPQRSVSYWNLWVRKSKVKEISAFKVMGVIISEVTRQATFNDVENRQVTSTHFLHLSNALSGLIPLGTPHIKGIGTLNQSQIGVYSTFVTWVYENLMLFSW